MKYTVGYLGNNPYIEEEFSKYYNPGEKEKIRYINISNLSEDMLDAISFNGIIFDTSAHEDINQTKIIDNIITSNDEIDIMPIITKKENYTNPEILKEIRTIKDKYNISSSPFLVTTKDEALVFSEGIFSTLSEKTIKHMEKVHQYMLNSQKKIVNFISKFACLLEIKDPYTEYHSLRVANYAKQIAIKLGLSEDKIESIYQAGKLHDIGKIVIADSILKKTDKLSDEEFSYMKVHAVIGEQLLEKSFEPGEFLDIKDAVKYHHSRYDGRGYPDKIAGEDIPLEARILCLADSFDAMTTKRTYNNPKTLEQSIEDLTRNAGQQFDPNLVEIFIDLLKNEPEKLDINIKNGVVMVKYASKEEKAFEEKHANANKIQKTQEKNIEDEQ